MRPLPTTTCLSWSRAPTADGLGRQPQEAERAAGPSHGGHRGARVPPKGSSTSGLDGVAHSLLTNQECSLGEMMLNQGLPPDSKF